MHIQSIDKVPWPAQEHRWRADRYKWYSHNLCLFISLFSAHHTAQTPLLGPKSSVWIWTTLTNFLSFLLIFQIFLSFSFFYFILINLCAVEHNHEEDHSRVDAARQAGCLIYQQISTIGSKMDKFSFDCTMIEYNTKDTT